MSMHLVFILIVFILAVIGFFLQEILAVVRRIFEVPGLKILIPLAIVSYLLEESFYDVSVVISYFQLALVSMEHVIEHLFPFSLGGAYLSQIFILLFVYCFPLFIATWHKKKRPLNEWVSLWDRLGAGVWLISLIALIMA